MHATMHGADGGSEPDAVARRLDAAMDASQDEASINYDLSGGGGDAHRCGEASGMGERCAAKDGESEHVARGEMSGAGDGEYDGEREYDGDVGGAARTTALATAMWHLRRARATKGVASVSATM